MSNIVMHVFLNDTHPLSLSPVPMGDISVHASVAAHGTTLENSTSSYHNHVSDTMQMTCSNEKGEITI